MLPVFLLCADSNGIFDLSAQFLLQPAHSNRKIDLSAQFFVKRVMIGASLPRFVLCKTIYFF